ncbi:MAG: cyclic nucleotide-binding domain-containing protein [Solirubrobacteraceae bacterium]
MIGVKAVRLLVLDPDLGGRLSAADLARAQRELLLLGIELPRGTLDPCTLTARGELRGRAIGAVVIEGVIVERLELEGRPCSRLVGTGDLIGAPEVGQLPLDVEVLLEVLEPAFIAVLDDRFLVATQRWPALAASILDRSIQRSYEALLRKAIAQLPRVEDRLLALFRSLAERWGRVRPNGIVIELALTHDLIGELIGARRPTVSLGLRALADAEQLLYLRSEGWLLKSPAAAVRVIDGAGAPLLRAVATDGVVLVGLDDELAGAAAPSDRVVRREPDLRSALGALAEPGNASVVVVDLSVAGFDEATGAAVELVRRIREDGARLIAIAGQDGVDQSAGARLLLAAAHDVIRSPAEPAWVAASVSEQLIAFGVALGPSRQRSG